MGRCPARSGRAMGSNLPEGKALLDAYMAALREAGATPARDWKLE